MLPSEAPWAGAGTRVRRVAIISAQAPPLALAGGIDGDGQQVYVAHLARELALAGCQVDIFTRRISTAQHQVLAWRDNIRVIHVPAGPLRRACAHDVLPHMDAFANFVSAFAGRQHLPYDVVHANSFMSGVVAQALKQQCGVPFVMPFHGLGQPVGAPPAACAPMARSLVCEADHIIAGCAQERDDLVQLHGASAHRVSIVPCAFDPQELWPVPSHMARQRLGLPGARFIILQLGCFTPHGGLDTTVHSLALLRHRDGIDAQLLIASGDDRQDGAPESERLRQLALSLDVAEHVRLCGRPPRSELRYYYGAADVVVTVPSHEPFAVTPVEAMACARPVVGAAVGAIKSTVLDGSTGYLVPAGDPEALSRRLALLRSNPELASHMGDEGMRHAFRHFTWRAAAARLGAIYSAVSASANRSIPTRTLRNCP